MLDTIEYERQELEILYQKLTGEMYEAVCLLEAKYYGGGVVYVVMHNGSCF